MTRPCKHLGVVLGLALGVAGLPASGLDLDKQVIAGGGGASSGGGFSLSGTVGQAVATESSSGGSYTLAAGFWNGFLLVGPDLSIEFLPATGEVRISWPLPDDGFVLEQSALLVSGNSWTPIPPGTYQSDASTRFVTLSGFNPGVQVFRLSRP